MEEFVAALNQAIEPFLQECQDYLEKNPDIARRFRQNQAITMGAAMLCPASQAHAACTHAQLDLLEKLHIISTVHPDYLGTVWPVLRPLLERIFPMTDFNVVEGS